MDTTYSDLILMIGGQVLFLYLLVMITLFGVNPITQHLPAGLSLTNTNTKPSSSSSSSSSSS